MSSVDRDPDARRSELIEVWERAAPGWGKRAARVRELSMPVSVWMVEQLRLAPGQRVLELAAGPGDTGFLAAELVSPGGELVCSDGAEEMLAVARARAGELGINNVEFLRLELEWIDLPTASVDAVLCRWGLMLVLDPAAALHEIRRVLRPGGRLALAVWDEPSRNPWATLSGRTLIALGHAEPPDPDAPGMFALAGEGRLRGMLADAGFVEALIDTIELPRSHESIDGYLEETLDLSSGFAQVHASLTEEQRVEVRDEIASLAEPFTREDGSVQFPASTLVALAHA